MACTHSLPSTPGLGQPWRPPAVGTEENCWAPGPPPGHKKPGWPEGAISEERAPGHSEASRVGAPASPGQGALLCGRPERRCPPPPGRRAAPRPLLASAQGPSGRNDSMDSETGKSASDLTHCTPHSSHLTWEPCLLPDTPPDCRLHRGRAQGADRAWLGGAGSPAPPSLRSLGAPNQSSRAPSLLNPTASQLALHQQERLGGPAPGPARGPLLQPHPPPCPTARARHPATGPRLTPGSHLCHHLPGLPSQLRPWTPPAHPDPRRPVPPAPARCWAPVAPGLRGVAAGPWRGADWPRALGGEGAATPGAEGPGPGPLRPITWGSPPWHCHFASHTRPRAGSSPPGAQQGRALSTALPTCLSSQGLHLPDLWLEAARQVLDHSPAGPAVRGGQHVPQCPPHGGCSSELPGPWALARSRHGTSAAARAGAADSESASKRAGSEHGILKGCVTRRPRVPAPPRSKACWEGSRP